MLRPIAIDPLALPNGDNLYIAHSVTIPIIHRAVQRRGQRMIRNFVVRVSKRLTIDRQQRRIVTRFQS